MRVLLALDGSPSSEAARQAVESLVWPSGSVVQVVGVIEPFADLGPPMVLAMSDTRVDEQAADELWKVLEEAAASISNERITARARVLVGRPATSIVDFATEMRAELIVVGSRGRGPLKSMVLGSVSAEVVDHAPCPVFVVRGPVEGAVLVAVDGSRPSDAAVSYLVGSRLFLDHPIEVLSVAPGSGSAISNTTMGVSDISIDVVDRRRRENRDGAEICAARAAMELRRAGYTTRWSISEGHAAHEIITTAKDFGCGLLVMGSRGLTGLDRILLGSVARNVLLHSSSSVLVVHEPLRERSPERAEAHRSTSPQVAAPA